MLYLFYCVFLCFNLWICTLSPILDQHYRNQCCFIPTTLKKRSSDSVDDNDDEYDSMIMTVIILWVLFVVEEEKHVPIGSRQFSQLCIHNLHVICKFLEGHISGSLAHTLAGVPPFAWTTSVLEKVRFPYSFGKIADSWKRNPYCSNLHLHFV